jgi:drug/metabolite transporter (DMT)-like permease
MLLAFFAWYRGLAIGGIARVSQVQLMQPFLSILFSALFLSEKITFLMVCTALIVVVSVAIGRKQPVEAN